MRVEVARQLDDVRYIEKQKLRRQIKEEMKDNKTRQEKVRKRQDYAKRLNEIEKEGKINTHYKAKEKLEEIKESLKNDRKSLRVMNSIENLREKALESLKEV